MHIERPKGLDLTDERVTLDLKDENGLRAATIVIVTGVDAMGNDVVKLNVLTIPGDEHLVVETRVIMDRVS